ncbi:hypothetical protein AYO40_00600 [Planctomycetaceae bacterium SCGC AG-212-D15]|nr:hypothetical protein AYO40_00600 [Planctomycetaceae bacterium SCGC AG-212-D15]
MVVPQLQSRPKRLARSCTPCRACCASNRLWRAELADQARQHDEVYTYDGIHRLKRLDRGTLNGGKTGVTGEQFAQCWQLDSVGNWKGFKQDNDGNGIWDVVQSRRSNQVNEIVCLDGPASQSGAMPLALPTPLGTVKPERSSWVVPQYDAAGNMTTMPQPANPYASFYAVWDAWNRMVTLTASGTSVGAYQYDGLRRRTVKQTFGPSTTRDFFYSAGWQYLEERVNASSNAQRQFVWGLQYIDDLVLRDRDTTGGGVLNERLFGMQDPNWNVTAVCDPTGTVPERYGYDAYGMSTVMNASFGVLGASGVDWETRFASGRWDNESGNNCLRLRYQLPILGCWGSREQGGITKGDVSLYAYVRNNVLNQGDPSGLKGISLVGAPAGPYLTTPAAFRQGTNAPDDPAFEGADVKYKNLGQLLQRLEAKIKLGDCLENLELGGHGYYREFQVGLYLAQRPSGQLDHIFGWSDATCWIHEDNVQYFADRLATITFCCPCTIYLSVCNLGNLRKNPLPQTVADATGCEVWAPRGFQGGFHLKDTSHVEREIRDPDDPTRLYRIKGNDETLPSIDEKWKRFVPRKVRKCEHLPECG